MYTKYPAYGSQAHPLQVEFECLFSERSIIPFRPMLLGEISLALLTSEALIAAFVVQTCSHHSPCLSPIRARWPFFICTAHLYILSVRCVSRHSPPSSLPLYGPKQFTTRIDNPKHVSKQPTKGLNIIETAELHPQSRKRGLQNGTRWCPTQPYQPKATTGSDPLITRSLWLIPNSQHGSQHYNYLHKLNASHSARVNRLRCAQGHHGPTAHPVQQTAHSPCPN